jgi:hypothetical protein
MRKLLALALVAVLAAACTSGSPPADAPRFNRYVITVEEMRAQNLLHATEAVRVLRPNWRTARIYSDPGLKPLAGLHDLPTDQTPAVLYFPPLEAQTRFGMDHSSGAIAILLRGGTLP